MAWGFESNRITTMRYIVMITKLKINKINKICTYQNKHDFAQKSIKLPS